MQTHSLHRARRYQLGDYGVRGYHPLVSSWNARVVAHGGAQPGVGTLDVLNIFALALDAASLTTKMKSVCCFVPDSLTAAITPLITNYGNDPWTDHSFVAGDLSVAGLAGASSKYLDTGVVPSAAFSADTSGGLTAYAAINAYVLGAGSASYVNAFGLTDDGSYIFYDCYGYTGGGRISATRTPLLSYYSGNRTAANAIAIYRARSDFAHAAIASGTGSASSTRGPDSLYCMAVNLGGSPAQYVTNTCSFAAIHEGLTAGESSAFYNAVQAMRTGFGGGYA